MSQEWNSQGNEERAPEGPASYQPRPGAGTPATPPPRKNNTWIYGVIIAILLGTNIYLFTQNRKKTAENLQVTTQRDSAVTTRESIRADYDAAIVRLDEMVSKNTALNSQLTDQNGEIAKLRHQIDGILKDKNASAADLARARKLITQLNGRVATYEEQIAHLRGENTRLTTENTSLSHERDSAVTQNVDLQQKVKLGAVLHASNIRMSAIDLRKNGSRQRETGKARKVDLLRILFDIDDNRIAESGPKELYLRISGPDGNLLSNAAYGSGTTTAASGDPLNYTLVKQIQLTQGRPVSDVVIDWQQDANYQRGTYNIEIYNEGYRIGNGSVTLH